MKTVALTKEQIYTGSLILVNEEYPYREELSGQELLPVLSKAPKILLHGRAVTILSSLMAGINGWEKISPVSGWRSMEEQIKSYEDSLLENGQEFTAKYVALPGHSEHQTELAIDLAKNSDNIDFIRPDFPYTGICQTFRQRALSYGFIERYPLGRETATGIAHEPWHFRYVGTPHAEIMAEKGLVLEEYIEHLKQYQYGHKALQYKTGDNSILIFYLPADNTNDTHFEIDDRFPYSISGNNVDGFIITQWRDHNGKD